MKTKMFTFKNLQRLISVVTLAMLLPLMATAQNLPVVSGTIIDDLAEPLIGVSVSVKDGFAGTVTDVNGSYSIGFPAGTESVELVYSYLGYSSQTQTISFSESNLVEFNIDMQPDFAQLDEVVITGVSAATSRKQLGNAISTVSAKDIENTGTTNVLGALSGKVMGALITQNNGDPGGGVSIRLRGTSTINGSSDPLYIVDGVIVDNSSQNVINLNADAMQTGFAAGQN